MEVYIQKDNNMRLQYSYIDPSTYKPVQRMRSNLYKFMIYIRIVYILINNLVGILL